MLLAALLAACTSAAPPRPAASDAGRIYTEAGLAAQSGRLLEAAQGYDQAGALDPGSVEIWLAASRAWARLGRWTEASERARRALDLAPADRRALNSLGAAYVAVGQLDEARAVYDDFIARLPGDAVAWAGRGHIAALQGDAELAERAFARSAELDETDPEVWEQLGVVRQQLGREAGAARAFERAVELAPERSPLNARVLALAIESGERDVARRAAARMTRGDAAPGAPSVAVATMLIKREDYVGAANELEWLLERRPDHHRARLMLARLLAHVGRPADARAQAEQIPESARERADALSLRAMLLLEGGEAGAAKVLLDEALTLEPTRPELVSGQARVLRAMGRADTAADLLAEAIRRWPNESGLRYQLAMLIHERGDEEAALDEMRGVLAVEPDHAGALNYVGYTYADRGIRLQEAERMIRRALEQHPDDGAILDSLGWVLFRLGRLEEAEQALRRASERAPEESEIHFHLAEVLWVAGRRDEARARYGDAVRLATDAKERARYEQRRRSAGKAR